MVMEKKNHPSYAPFRPKATHTYLTRKENHKALTKLCLESLGCKNK